MTLMNTRNTYGSTAKFFHWLLAILIIGMIIFGYCIDLFPSKSTQHMLIGLHKSTGLLILALMLARLLWRWISPPPELPKQMPTWQKFLANATHTLLYVVAFMMPLSGWIATTAGGHPAKFYGLFILGAPGVANNKAVAKFIFNFHVYGAYILIGLLVLHVLATLKHHYIDKDDTLTRILPSK